MPRRAKFKIQKWIAFQKKNINSLDLPMKTIAAMNKVCRGFLWCRRAEANGGNCAVAWEAVCAPKWAGGLGIPNLNW